MKKLIHSVLLPILAFSFAVSSFARNMEQRGPGFDSDLRKEVDEVRTMAHRLQGELNFQAANARLLAEVSEVDRDVFRFNSLVSSRHYTSGQIRSEVERIREEFLDVEREVRQYSASR